MRSIYLICIRDLRSFFYSPVAYALLSIFFCMAAYFFFNLLGSFNAAVLQEAQVPVGDLSRSLNLNEWVFQGFFQTVLLLLVLIIPLICMNCLSEERESGTFLLLATLPVRVREVVLGKYFARLILLVFMLVLVTLLPLSVCFVSNPEIPPMLTAVLGLFFIVMAFTAIGVAVSFAVGHSLLSGIITFAVLIVLYGAHIPSESVGESGRLLLRYLSPLWQMRDLFRGVLTPAPFVYLSSVTLLALLFAYVAVRQRFVRGIV